MGMSMTRSARASHQSNADSTALTGADGTAMSVPASSGVARPMALAHGEHQRKQGEVRIGEPHDLEAGMGQHPTQAAARRAVHFPPEQRVVASQHAERRHVHDHPATRTQHAEHLGHRRPLLTLVQRIEHIERGHQVEEPGAHRDVGHRCAGHAALSRPIGHLDAPLRDIQAERAAEFGEDAKVGAGPTAAVEDGRRCATGDRLDDERPNEGAEASEPEVDLFGAIGSFEKAIHNSAIECIGAHRPQNRQPFGPHRTAEF